MAIYHLTTRNISRGKGKSAVAKAAYNARTQLTDERLGVQTRDYSDEGAVLFTGIFAPRGAPAWTHDRAQLWNRVEAAETRKDARVAREIEIALPHELTDAQREWLVKDFVREQFVRQGMIADVAIHAPDGDARNYHAHILLTTREIDGNGFAATKRRDWNSTAQLQHWREQWQHLANRHLERHGVQARIDCRTLAAQGIDREPGIHLGPEAAALEARGVPTERGAHLQAIAARNAERQHLQTTLQRVNGALAHAEELEARQRRDARLGATLYDRADMASMQRDALRDLREREQARQLRERHEPAPTPATRQRRDEEERQAAHRPERSEAQAEREAREESREQTDRRQMSRELREIRERHGLPERSGGRERERER